MNRRDLLLTEMQISQWVLTKPQVLKGDAQIRLDPAVKLVVICEEDHQQSQLFQDVLRTLSLSSHNYQWLNTSQANRLLIESEPLFWLIQPEKQAVAIQQKFAKLFPNLTACIYSSWDQLHQPAIKRQFWQQIEPYSLQVEPD